MGNNKRVRLSSARNLSIFFDRNNKKKRKKYKLKDLDKIAKRSIGQKKLDENIRKAKSRIKKKK